MGIGEERSVNRTCVLLRLPGYPFQLDALLPDRRLAEAAAVLDGLAFPFVTLDLGTPDLATQVVPSEHRAITRRVVDRFLEPVEPGGVADLHVLWALRSTHRAFLRRRGQACAAAAEIAARHHPDLVCLSVHTMDDVAAARVVSERIVAARSGVRVVLMGAAAESWRGRLLDNCPACRGVIWGTIGSVLPRLLRPDSTPTDTPGFSARPSADSSRRTSDRDHRTLAATDVGTKPAYNPALYPALADRAAKLQIFEINDRPAAGSASACASADGDAGGDVGLPSIASHCDIIEAVMDQLGARAFHFLADGASERRAAALHMGLTHRNLNPVFSRSCHIARTSPHAMALLRRCGCEAVRLQVESGSQRLLEDYYGYDTTVTHAETTLRTARDVGLFAVAEFGYPAPADDRHTAAETLRLAVRTGLQAAIVRLPFAAPSDAWARDPERYGFAAAEPRPPAPTRFPLPVDRWQLPACRHGSRSHGEVVHAQEQFIADLAQCGVNTAVSEHLALIARALGSGACAGEFATRVVRMLYTGDAESLRSLVRQFNDAARTMPAPAVQTESSPVRRAVGD